MSKRRSAILCATGVWGVKPVGRVTVKTITFSYKSEIKLRSDKMFQINEHGEHSVMKMFDIRVLYSKFGADFLIVIYNFRKIVKANTIYLSIMTLAILTTGFNFYFRDRLWPEMARFRKIIINFTRNRGLAELKGFVL